MKLILMEEACTNLCKYMYYDQDKCMTGFTGEYLLFVSNYSWVLLDIHYCMCKYLYLCSNTRAFLIHSRTSRELSVTQWNVSRHTKEHVWHAIRNKIIVTTTRIFCCNTTPNQRNIAPRQRNITLSQCNIADRFSLQYYTDSMEYYTDYRYYYI